MPLKVILIDDEPTMCWLFRTLYSSATIHIDAYSDVALGMEAINLHKPDLVILDYRLPHTNGDQLAATLDPELPKVLISGDLSVEVKSHFVRQFAKPFNLDEMRNFLQLFSGAKGNAT
jgi:DNA-binding NtrC family response regulator